MIHFEMQAGLCTKESEERCDSLDEPTTAEIEAHDWMMTELIYCLDVSHHLCTMHSQTVLGLRRESRFCQYCHRMRSSVAFQLFSCITVSLHLQILQKLYITYIFLKFLNAAARTHPSGRLLDTSQ